VSEEEEEGDANGSGSIENEMKSMNENNVVTIVFVHHRNFIPSMPMPIPIRTVSTTTMEFISCCYL